MNDSSVETADVLLTATEVTPPAWGPGILTTTARQAVCTHSAGPQGSKAGMKQRAVLTHPEEETAIAQILICLKSPPGASDQQVPKN